MRQLGSLMGFGVIAGVAAASGCGRAFVLGESTGGSAASSAATNGSGNGSGGAGGVAASLGGAGGAAPAACSPGVGVALSSCGKDEYCNADTAACESCAALDRLRFGAPVALGVAPVTQGATLMFPRRNTDTGDLFLVQQLNTAANPTQIADAPFVSSKAEWSPTGLVPALAGTYLDTGPLYLTDASVLAGLIVATPSQASTPALLFDSDRTLNKRKVFALSLGGPANATMVQLDLPGGAAHESSIAVATDASPPRFFWISDANGAAMRLVTAIATDGSPTDVPITLDDGCPAPLAGKPWVTPGGEWLLFASTHPDTPACAVPASDAPTHLYAAKLGADGQQTGSAAPVFGAADANLDDSPSLFTPSMCALLFARFDVNGTGAIYAAQRE
jgi:hypothetical protein